MKQLVLDQPTAISLYPSAAPEFKVMLESSFGKTLFLKKITERVTTWEDVCREANVDPINYLPYPPSQRDEDVPLTEEEESINAFAKVSLIRKVLNEEWVADWDNDSQYKYHICFNMSPSGFGLDYVLFWNSLSVCGSRLVFRSDAVARHAAKHFLPVFKTLFLISNK